MTVKGVGESMSVLKISDLYKIYGKNENEVRAVNGVNLNIEKGEFVAIVGSSGSGKSTLLHIIGGVDEPSSGKVSINGKSLYELDDEEQSKMRRNEISLIYQFYNLIPTLNARENAILPVELDRRSVDEVYLSELFKLLKLENRLKHFPNELSGGEQQRVAIARALINKPSLLLADEPTGNLDSKNSIEIMELLKKANSKYGQTIVMVTHDRELAKYAKRILTIEDGKIVKDEVLYDEHLE